MKKILGLFGILLLFLAAIFAALAMFPPVGLAKRLLVAGTRTATGLDLQINGPMTLRLVPSVSLHMENVVLANPSAAASAPVLVASAVDVNTGYAAALGASHVVDSVRLTNPVIAVETDKQGRHSWQPSAPAAETREAAPRTRRGFSLARVEVSGGTVSYRDHGSDRAVRLERAEATLLDVSEERLGQALIKAGAATWLEQSSGTSVEIADLDAKAAGLTAARIGSVTAAGSSLRWRDRTQPSGIEALKFTAAAEALGLDGSGPLKFSGGSLSWRDPSGGGTLTAESLETAARALKGGRLDEVTFKSGRIALDHKATGSIAIGTLAGTAKAARFDVLDEVSFAGGTFAFNHPSAGRLDASNVAASIKTARLDQLDDVTVKSAGAGFEHPTTGRFTASSLTAAAKTATPVRLQGFALTTASLGIPAATRASGSSPITMQELSIAAPELAAGKPLEAAVAFVHNKDRVSGSVRLPPPEALMAGPAFPANVMLKASRGSIDFDGRLDTAAGAAKGRTRASTTSIDALASWLGITVPPTLKGAAELSGEIDAAPQRIALSGSRVQHGQNSLSGDFAVDLGAARPKLSGRITADKLDADAYLGVTPVKPRPKQDGKPSGGGKPQVIEPEVELGDVFKSYMRAMLDAPVKRGGTLDIPALPAEQLLPAATRGKPRPGAFTWSEDKLDFSALRALDLDVEWSVKQLTVRGMALAVPQLKTVLDDGALTLEGRDLGTKDGKLSGRATIDARKPAPSISANVKGEGVDLYALSEAVGITPMLDGDTALEASLTTSGASQKQLVEQLSGTVRTNMPQGHVLGYDLGDITLGTIIRWITGNREYDPERRTPVSGLITDLSIDKGVVKESKVTMGGPLLGVNAEGTIGLVEQRLDMSGRARIASFFRGLPFRVFGNWSQPTVQPDLSLASVFSRSAPGEASLADIIANADIKPDAELALLIGRVLQKAGPSGLDAGTRAFLEGIQKRAIGN